MAVSKLNPQRFATIRLVATDMDGTLTRDRQFRPKLLEALYRLQAANIAVVIVTGRSAGWASAIAHYLPVQGVIAENGGVFCPSDRAADTTAPQFLISMGDETVYRQKLATMFAQLQQIYPRLQPAADNRYRLTDWTFDVAGLSPTEIETLSDRCRAAGWDLTYSTVQCHIKAPYQSKSAGLHQILAAQLTHIEPAEVVTVGDSPNDESLFDPGLFPVSVGVANIEPYLSRLRHHPQYITRARECDGFCEVVEAILANQQRSG